MVAQVVESTENPPPKRPLNLDDAYAVESPEDSIRLYREWAETYESEFVASHRYVYPFRLVEVFAAEADRSDGPVLDVGCGTGVVAQELNKLGGWAIDGLDISAEMLAVAHEKLNQIGEPLYGALVEADLTKPLDITSHTYGSVVSAGTFTIGHVGPAAVGELARIVRPGGLLVLGVNSVFYEQSDFGSHVQSLVDEGVLGPVTLHVIGTYDMETGPHADDTSNVVVARTR